MILFSTISLLIVTMDQLIKFFIERNIHGKSIELIEDIFYLTYVQNYGAAWGIFSNSSWILKIITPILIFLIVFYLYKQKNTKFELLVGGIVIGGAVSNYADRIFRGYVVDYIDFKVWPVFNFADICIVIGCFLFIINLLVKEKLYGN